MIRDAIEADVDAATQRVFEVTQPFTRDAFTKLVERADLDEMQTLVAVDIISSLVADIAVALIELIEPEPDENRQHRAECGGLKARESLTTPGRFVTQRCPHPSHTPEAAS